MIRVGQLVIVVALAGATAVSPSWAKAPKNGVFGSINGKKFKATNVQGATDPCVAGIWDQATGVIVFSAIECKPHRRRQGAPRKNYKTIVVGCNINYTMPGPTTRPLVAPSMLVCPASAYTETKTGRFHIAKSMETWNSDSEILPDFSISSHLMMRLDSFDGSVASGALLGSFDVPQPPATGSAAINGEIDFRFPFRVQ
jgi:hypothetical protein